MRKILIVLGGVLLIGLGVYIKNVFANSKKSPELKTEEVVKTAFVETVKNQIVPIIIKESGNLQAKNKVELFSEVQGVLQSTGKSYKPGVRYNKGEVLLHINNEEYLASIKAQRSSFQSLIASVLPDLQLDYPTSYGRWNTYLQSFDVDQIVKSLPEPLSDQERYFITGRNIYSMYHSIKNLETRLTKYKIKAPFDGILTETLVTEGSLVRVGQKMGEFINSDSFELPIAVNASMLSYLQIGKEVMVNDLENTFSVKGEVVRINGKIESATQTVQLFIELRGSFLKEGMFLEAQIPVQEAKESIKTDRKLIVNNNFIYIVKDGKLTLEKVEVLHYDDQSAIVRGLKDGSNRLIKTIPGAYEGMSVKLYSSNEKK